MSDSLKPVNGQTWESVATYHNGKTAPNTITLASSSEEGKRGGGRQMSSEASNTAKRQERKAAVKCLSFGVHGEAEVPIHRLLPVLERQ